MTAFPDTLPNQDSGVRGTVATPCVTTSMSTGPAVVRRLSTSAMRTFQVRWELDEDQLATFEDFYRDTIAAGTDSFVMPMAFGEGIINVTMRFVANSYSQDYVGEVEGKHRWKVSAVVELHDDEFLPQLSASEYDGFELVEEDGSLTPFEDAVHRLAVERGVI